MRDHVSAHGAEDPKDLKGRRRLQREDSELSETRGQGKQLSWSLTVTEAMGIWVCPSTPLVLITGSLEGDSHTLNLEVRKQGQGISGWPEITQPLCGRTRCQSVCPIPMHLFCVQSSLCCSVVPDKLCTLRKTRSSLCLPNRNLTQNKVSFIASPQKKEIFSEKTRTLALDPNSSWPGYLCQLF